MDPTAEQIAAFTTINDVITWAAVGDTVAPLLRTALGATGEEHPRLVGAMSEEEYSAATDGIRIPAGEGESPTPLSPIQKAAVRLVGHGCRVASGARIDRATIEGELLAARKRAEEATQLALASAKEGSGSGVVATSGLVEMGSVINQSSKESRPPITAEQVKSHYDEYRHIFGRDPQPEEECSGQQLTGVHHLLSDDLPPYVDFGVWGPHHHRMIRKLRFTGTRFGANGVLQNVEILGPGSLQQWRECYQLLITALVGFKAVSLGNLLSYGKKIEQYVDLYGMEIWALLYQADVRCRLEHMERLRRKLEREHAAKASSSADNAAAAAGGTASAGTLTPSRPWDAVWAAAIDDVAFWTEQVERPGGLILAKVRNLNDHVMGDAPVPGSLGKAAGGGRKRPADEGLDDPWPRRRPKAQRLHQVTDDRFTANRSGRGLCSGFNDGSCVNSGTGIKCEHNPALNHQCARCLSPHHGAHACQATPKAPSYNAKGKGKRGAGKSKDKGRHKWWPGQG